MKEDASGPTSARTSGGGDLREPAHRSRAERPAPRTESIPGNPPAVEAEPQRLFNALLADEFVLYVRTLNYHWNVRGMQFHSLHAFFETLSRAQAEIIDAVAGRVRALGAYATASLEEYLGLTRLKEKLGEPPDPRQMILALSADFETLIKEVREVIREVEGKVDDPSTVNFLTSLLERHEKTLWMLQAHLDRDLV